MFAAKLNHELNQDNKVLIWNIYSRNKLHNFIRYSVLDHFGTANVCYIFACYPNAARGQITLPSVGVAFKKQNDNNSWNCEEQLRTRLVNVFLRVQFNGMLLRHEFEPVYLGVKLDGSLTYHSHTSKAQSETRYQVQTATQVGWYFMGSNCSVFENVSTDIFMCRILLYVLAKQCSHRQDWCGT